MPNCARRPFAAFWLLVAISLAQVAAAPAEGADPPRAQAARANAAELARIETYLNQIDTLVGRFLQVSSNGGVSEGTIVLDRPGRMRIDYDPPVPIEIIAKGSTVVFHDKELKQVSWIGVDRTPAAFLLADRISLSGHVRVVGFERGENSLRVELVKTAEPGEGSIVLIFGDSPLALRKWIVTDSQGIQTTVTLMGARLGVAVDPKLFDFVNPYPFRDDS